MPGSFVFAILLLLVAGSENSARPYFYWLYVRKRTLAMMPAPLTHVIDRNRS